MGGCRDTCATYGHHAFNCPNHPQRIAVTTPAEKLVGAIDRLQLVHFDEFGIRPSQCHEKLCALCQALELLEAKWTVRAGEASLVEVIRGWLTYDDGSTSPIERWVRAADGDWISLDSTRRTSRDIHMEVNP